jgi:hypothetical protein
MKVPEDLILDTEESDVWNENGYGGKENNYQQLNPI